MCGIFADAAQHREAFPGRRVSQWLVRGICGRDDLLHGLFQKALVKGRNGHFAQNREKILMQRVRIMRIGGFFYAVPQGVQPHLSQYFKGQVGSFQVVEACLCFLLNQHSFYICINCAIDVAPLDFAFLCARFDVSTFPPTILAFVNVFSPSCHFCFLLRLGHPSDHLFCPPSFLAGFFMQNWAKCKKLSASARFFLRSGGIHLYGFLLIPRYNHDRIIGRIKQ